MIGLILGTSEGKKIVSLLNEFTDDLFISTATAYGGHLLEKYKYKILNIDPLDAKGMIHAINTNNIHILIDASHPYAVEVTKNAIDASRVCRIQYIRYERPSIINKYINRKNIIIVNSYEELYKYLINIRGNILNTTGSRNIEKILDMNLSNRIIHRVLPSSNVIEKLYKLGIRTENIIAIKGPVSYDLNYSFIKEYKVVAVLMKDSGIQGGTEEKINATLDCGAYAFVIARKNIQYDTQHDKVFSCERTLVEYIKKIL